MYCEHVLCTVPDVLCTCIVTYLMYCVHVLCTLPDVCIVYMYCVHVLCTLLDVLCTVLDVLCMYCVYYLMYCVHYLMSCVHYCGIVMSCGLLPIPSGYEPYISEDDGWVWSAHMLCS